MAPPSMLSFEPTVIQPGQKGVIPLRWSGYQARIDGQASPLMLDASLPISQLFTIRLILLEANQNSAADLPGRLARMFSAPGTIPEQLEPRHLEVDRLHFGAEKPEDAVTVHYAGVGEVKGVGADDVVIVMAQGKVASFIETRREGKDSITLMANEAPLELHVRSLAPVPIAVRGMLFMKHVASERRPTLAEVQ